MTREKNRADECRCKARLAPPSGASQTIEGSRLWEVASRQSSETLGEVVLEVGCPGNAGRWAAGSYENAPQPLASIHAAAASPPSIPKVGLVLLPKRRWPLAFGYENKVERRP